MHAEGRRRGRNEGLGKVGERHGERREREGGKIGWVEDKGETDLKIEIEQKQIQTNTIFCQRKERKRERMRE